MFFFSHQHFLFFWFKKVPRKIFLKQFLRTKFSIFSSESFFKHILCTLFLGPLNIRCSNIFLASCSQTFSLAYYSHVFFSGILLLNIFLVHFAIYFPQHPVSIYFISNLPSNNSPATYSQTFSQYIFPCVLFSYIFFSILFSNIFLMLFFSNNLFNNLFSNIFLVLLFSNIYFSILFSYIYLILSFSNIFPFKPFP